MLKRVIQTIVGFALAAGLLYWTFRGKGAEVAASIVPLLQNADKLQLVAAVLLLFLSNLVRAVRWIIFANRPVSVLTSFAGVSAGYAVNNILPRGGEVVRLLYLSRAAHIPASTVTATIGVERLLDIVALAMLIACAVALAPDRGFLASAEWFGYARVFMGAAVLGLVALVLLVRSEVARKRFRSMESRAVGPRTVRIYALIRSFAEGFRFMRSTRSWLLTLVWTLLIWSLYLVVLGIGLDAFNLYDRLGPRGVFFMFSMVGISTLIPTPASAGGYHLVGTYILSRMYGIEEGMALAFITAFHGITYFVTNGVLCVLVWGADVLYRRRKGRAL